MSQHACAVVAANLCVSILCGVAFITYMEPIDDVGYNFIPSNTPMVDNVNYLNSRFNRNEYDVFQVRPMRKAESDVTSDVT